MPPVSNHSGHDSAAVSAQRSMRESTLTFEPATAMSDEEFFEDLVRRHYKQAYSIAYRLSGSHSDAEDLVQEAMVRAYQSFGRYRRDLPFANWLYRIISNLHIDEVRRRPKAPIHSLDEEPWMADVPDLGSDPSRLVLDKQLDGRIQQALTTMTEEFRMSVVLCDIEGFSYEEIAEIMKCSLGTVRSRVHRGRKQLRARLGTIDPNFGANE
jgi:RNA polymerase sigma-70 factor, ECF subfamily